MPKKGKKAFAPHKPTFVKNNGKYCNKCKLVGHLEECTSKKAIFSIKFDSCYVVYMLDLLVLKLLVVKRMKFGS